MPAEFKEVGRVPLTDRVEAVLSEVIRDGKLTGYNLNKYVTSENFTGYTKGIYIPEDMLIEFLKIFPQEALDLALEEA